MTEKVISSLHIQKLGHEIQEIRERALLNISSKLDHGFVYDNDLARSKEILSKLFEWFLYEPCTKQELVFSLIKRIFQVILSKNHIQQSESGKILINHHGTILFKNELKQIRTFVEPKYYPLLDEIIQILNKSDVLVPLLETDVSLSHRTRTDFSSSKSRPVGTTATTIEGFIQQEASANERYGLQSAPVCDTSPSSYVIIPLKWQNLIEPDRHVLQSIENSLRNPPQPSSLLHSSDFFTNILLRDFPAEVFLQRPTITVNFQDLIYNCPSTRVTNSVLNCLNQLTKALQVRINHYNDPCMCNSKENVCSQVDSRSSSPDSTSRKTGSGQSNEEYQMHENSDYLKTQQMSFPQYCFSTFRCVFKYLCVKSETIKQNKLKINQKGVNLALSLLEELLNLLGMVLKEDIWTEESSPFIQDIRKQMNEILIGYGTTLEYFRIEATSDDSNLNNRVAQLCFLHNCGHFLVKMIPITQTGLILPRNLKNALANSLVDVTLAKLYPELYKTLLNYVQSFRVGLDGDSLTKYHETNRICDSMTAAVQFMKNWKSLNAAQGIDLAKKALPTIGPKLNTSCTGVPGAQILFLLRPKVLVEIACQGLTNDNFQVRNYSEDILLHIIKCKILVSEEIWNKVVETLIVSLPILLCYANQNSSLGRSLFDMIDPDTAKTLFLPKNEVIKGNIQVLFGPDVLMREEAFSRLCWLLASQTDSRDMLPRLNNLYDKALPNVCQIQRIFDINKNRTAQHFYQPSSLQQVLDLLKASNVEPVIRRSALTQTSVMMEDSIMHATFLEKSGLEIVLNILKSALIEKNFNDYPDSVIPTINILKNICLFQSSARQSLCMDTEVYYNVLRSLFLFFTEEKLKHDAVCLLFLLIFSDFIRGSPSKADLSVPYLVTQLLRVPFSCNTYWEISPHFEESLVSLLTTDKWCLSSLQIQWNSEMFGGIDELLSWNHIDYGESNIEDILKLTNYDLTCLKASSVDYYVKKYLTDIQNGTTHETVTASINKLTTYVHLYKFMPKENHFLQYAWEATFVRFLKDLPSSEEDAKLLSRVLKFLTFLLPFYKSSAYLDSLLACLVHLTATLGWTNSKPGSPPKRILFELVASLCELVVVFHCGKGPTATVSVMGLSITRNVILTLNHLLAEMHNSKMKNWESCFMDVEEEGWLKSFLMLWSSRDVLLRAGALQFFAGLSTSPLLAINIVNVDHDEASIVKENCACLLANFLAHTSVNHSNKLTIVTSLVPNTMRKLSCLIQSIFQGKDDIATIFDLLEDYQFYKNLIIILTELYTNNIIDFEAKSVTHLMEYTSPYRNDSSDESSNSNKSSRNKNASVVTPSLIKNLTNLLITLLNLNEDRLANILQDFGLVKLLFRCICNPAMSINDTKKLSLYCEILEMDTSICSLLSQAAQVSEMCLGTLLHTKDCLSGVVSLLNPHIYHLQNSALLSLTSLLGVESQRFESIQRPIDEKIDDYVIININSLCVARSEEIRL
ncbi:rotatin [Asbolus verrucosus]|uniref:Rotatin n=1 Tax=Asbolus verrucosus TaxID=1661398 RepID=A0A482WA51_ASBVE|nr:rotatin [Asbolus verrucosus]